MEMIGFIGLGIMVRPMARNLLRAGYPVQVSDVNPEAPMMLAHSFAPGFRIDLHVKDLNNTLQAGSSSHSPMPLTEMTMDMLCTLQGKGFGSEDHSALFREISLRFMFRSMIRLKA